ncbi:apolipoprotein N-acyltransferase [Granulicella sibirica]|uniref:Apolipoprotein N-acyltransferase n=1 Tax=Granulicella sibirica TaxID=2479048 RepID=A0A4Q0SX20_9BACT|nr:apolipoprotein N-acyltransferase [Granulicella sibirica]RXH55665.1 Apolipoprotein N-acyltransferase [Granulicella sibirica]
MRSLPARLWALAAVSGVLQVLPFPIAGPVPLWRTAFCWFALVPLIYSSLSTEDSGRPVNPLHAAFLGYLCGFVFYLGNCYWIFQTMNLYGGLPQPVAGGILALFCLYLGLYHALFGALLAAVRIRFGRQNALLLSPFLWVAVELARARITGFPWDLLGITQVDNPLLTRLVPFTGAYGLSFLIASVNALWLVRIRLRHRPYLRPTLTASGIVFAVLYVYFLRLIPPVQNAPASASATLVQENLEVGAANTGPQETREELLASFSNLSRNPVHTELNGIPGLPSTSLVRITEFPYVEGPPGYQPADLIVWPESPAGFRTDDPTFRAATSNLARATSAPLVLGALGVVPDPTTERGGHVYDSAALITPNGTQAGRYDKIHLVPFGEYIPFKNLFFFARKLTAGVGDMDRGADRTVFRAATSSGTHAFGIFICYESIFGNEVRQFVANGAEVLVNISDDGWYGDSGAPWQHLNMVRMRAIENHRWILRATNTGITSTINPSGHVVAALPRHIRSSINVPFAFEQGTTFYTRHGDLFAYLCALVTLAALAFTFEPQVN